MGVLFNLLSNIGFNIVPIFDFRAHKFRPIKIALARPVSSIFLLFLNLPFCGNFLKIEQFRDLKVNFPNEMKKKSAGKVIPLPNIFLQKALLFAGGFQPPGPPGVPVVPVGFRMDRGLFGTIGGPIGPTMGPNNPLVGVIGG